MNTQFGEWFSSNAYRHASDLNLVSLLSVHRASEIALVETKSQLIQLVDAKSEDMADEIEDLWELYLESEDDRAFLDKRYKK